MGVVSTMGSAYASPVPVHIALRLPDFIAVMKLRAAVALLSLATAGAATALLLPHSAAPPNNTVVTPVATTPAPH